MRAFRPLFYTGTFVQLISVPVHFSGMLHKRVAANDQEKMLSDLLHTYRFNLGAGFVRTMSDFLTGFSVIYGVFILFWLNQRVGDSPSRGFAVSAHALLAQCSLHGDSNRHCI